MTAFGRGVAESELGRVSVEVQSVNRRYLDVNVIIPPELSSFEFDVKKWVSASMGRGQVTVRVVASYSDQAPLQVKPNLALARQLNAACQTMTEELDLGASQQFTQHVISRMRELWVVERSEDMEGYRGLLSSGVEEALKFLLETQAREGAALAEDILPRLEVIAQNMKRIESRTSDSTAKMEAKLRERVELYFSGQEDTDERILREISLFAGKVDVTEEITRFNYHLADFKGMVAGKSAAPGKKLDVVLQELVREVNTIASKSADIEMSRAVVDIKTELERVREQVQNVE